MVSVPSNVILNDSIRKQTLVLEKLEKWLELSYLATQEEEAEKTPKKVRPYTINVVAPTVGPGTPSPQAVQVLPRNFARHDVALYNNGPGDILYSPSVFDPASILQQFSDPNHPDTITPAPNQLIQIGFMPSGSSMTITATDALWVWNNSTNAVLTILESVYGRAGNSKGPIPPPGLDGAIGAGYGTAADVDGNPILVKGLR